MGRVMRIRLRYCYADQDRHGNVRYYVKKPGGRKIRIREEPGTEAFMRAYHAALDGRDLAREHGGEPEPTPPKPKAKPDTFRWLVEEYYRSAEWQGLSPSTQTVRRRILDRFCADHGDKPYRLLEARHVRRMRDDMADRPEAANNWLKILKRLYGWAQEYEHVKHNPAADVRKIKTASTGHHTWTVAEVRQFQATHPIGTKARLALDLLLYTGVRRSDVVKLGPQLVRDGWLCFTETKGANRNPKRREIPILPPLQESIDAAPSGHLAYLVTAYGQPHTEEGFGNWFKKQCRRAGLEHCTAHGMRKAGATIAAYNGATDRELMAIFGWETAAQATTYTQDADRRRLIEQAMHKLDPDYGTGDERIFPTVEHGSTHVGTTGGKNPGKSGGEG